MSTLSENLPPPPEGFSFGGTLGEIITKLMPYLFTFAGMLALLFLIWGGLRYLTSRGDPKAADAARGIMTSAVIGLVVVLLSAAIFILVSAATGINPFTALVPTAHAVDIGDTVQLGGGIKINSFESFGELFTNVVRVALVLGGLAFLAMMVWGGYKFLSSGGDQKAADAARGTLTSAVIGLVIIVVSFVIIEIVTNISGATSIFT